MNLQAVEVFLIFSLSAYSSDEVVQAVEIYGQHKNGTIQDEKKRRQCQSQQVIITHKEQQSQKRFIDLSLMMVRLNQLC